MKKICTIFTFVLLSVSLIKAQDLTNIYHFDYNKLKPIVQVFGTAGYDLENNTCSYSFGRAHLGFQYQFNNKWNAKVIIDRGRPTSFSDLAVTDLQGNAMNVSYDYQEGSYYTFWLKYASLQWKVNDRLTIEGGAILQNHYITQERFWGLRYVAQTFQDLYWKMPSSDLGFIAYYKINNIFSFDAAITNGEGPRIIQDAFGKVKFAGGINVNPSEKIQTRIFYHIRQSRTDSEKNEQLFSVFAGYKPTAKFRIGSEFNYMKNLNNNDSLNSYGLSVYTSYKLTNKTDLFARYDRLFYETPTTFSTSSMAEGNAIITGISISPVNGVNLSLNYHGWIPDSVSQKQKNSVLLSMEYKF